MAQNLPEVMLRYMNAPFTRKLRGYGAIQESDNNQLVALLANKPDVMTPQAWANAGGANWDADGALYQKYVALRRERGLPTTAAEANPARAAALEAQGLDGDTIEKTLMQQNPTPLPFDARAAALKDMGTTPAAFDKMVNDARALPVPQPDYLGTTPRDIGTKQVQENAEPPPPDINAERNQFQKDVRQFVRKTMTPTIGEQLDAIKQIDAKRASWVNAGNSEMDAALRFPYPQAIDYANPATGANRSNKGEGNVKITPAESRAQVPDYDPLSGIPIPKGLENNSPATSPVDPMTGIPFSNPPARSPSISDKRSEVPPPPPPSSVDPKMLSSAVRSKTLASAVPISSPNPAGGPSWDDSFIAKAVELLKNGQATIREISNAVQNTDTVKQIIKAAQNAGLPAAAAADTATNNAPPASVAAAAAPAPAPVAAAPYVGAYNPNGKFNVPNAAAVTAPVAEALAATAPKLTDAQLEDRVAASGDMTFGRNALVPQETTASSTRRVQTSGTGQPTRTASQQMYYYDPGDGGPIRLMGGALPKGMAAGSQQGGGYIFGQEVSPDRTAAQKFVQGDASGVGNALSSLFNKFTAKKPGTVDPLTGKSYEPIAPSEDVQQESRGGKIHSGHATHDGKCHVGIIQMAVGGRTDHLPMNVYANSYVIPADVVSGLGEGNTLSGGHILDKMFSGDALNKMVSKTVKVPRKASGGPLPISAPMQMGQYQVVIPEVMNFGPPDYEKTGPFGTETVSARANPKFPDARYSWRYTETPPGEKPKAGAARGGMINDRHAKPVEILAAGGEYVIPPEVVRSLGHGNADDGHKWLDNFVKSTRAHTIRTMQKLPGPKKD